MTQEQFNTWVEKNYPKLLGYAKNMEEEPDVAEELLQDTLLDILEHGKYTEVVSTRTDDKNPLYWLTTYMKGIRANRRKKEYRRLKHEFPNGLEEPDSDGPLLDYTVYDPYPGLDAKILTDEIYNQLGPCARVYIHGLRNGYTALEAYNFSALGVSYSYYLKQVKADLERVLL